ncbi:quaternary ammonium transporter [Paenibacillus helianthi]|uniref:Quaternary ammonium transporter n=1 Tax=Paenibacillus helianthi TaxID=1349432 RepID=A0ABX3ES03_9BACL|nr:multidrug efflux SMR transporter [Paenibacillus helianthi]OKP90463.1 quaternary ammonium transporter [Paenibacillus helianthi]
MNPYFILACSILAEVFGSSMLKLSNGFKNIYPSIGVIVGMSMAFYGLSVSIETIPLGTAYAIWSGAGTALTSVIGIVIYKEVVNIKKIAGILCIISGVVFMKIATN